MVKRENNKLNSKVAVLESEVKAHGDCLGTLEVKVIDMDKKLVGMCIDIKSLSRNMGTLKTIGLAFLGAFLTFLGIVGAKIVCG